MTDESSQSNDAMSGIPSLLKSATVITGAVMRLLANAWAKVPSGFPSRMVSPALVYVTMSRMPSSLKSATANAFAAVATFGVVAGVSEN